MTVSQMVDFSVVFEADLISDSPDGSPVEINTAIEEVFIGNKSHSRVELVAKYGADFVKKLHDLLIEEVCEYGWE